MILFSGKNIPTAAKRLHEWREWAKATSPFRDDHSAIPTNPVQGRGRQSATEPTAYDSTIHASKDFRHLRCQADHTSKAKEEQIGGTAKILGDIKDLFKVNHRVPSAVKDRVKEAGEALFRFQTIRERHLKLTTLQREEVYNQPYRSWLKEEIGSGQS